MLHAAEWVEREMVSEWAVVALSGSQRAQAAAESDIYWLSKVEIEGCLVESVHLPSWNGLREPGNVASNSCKDGFCTRSD